jgi:hypothetical protein
MKERSLFRCGFGRKVGFNIFVPETETRKDMARHVKCVRCGWSNLRVPPSRIETQRGHPRIIRGMNNEVDNAGIVGFDF